MTQGPCDATTRKPWPYAPALCPTPALEKPGGRAFRIRGPGPQQGLWGTGVSATSQSRGPLEVGSGWACAQGRRGARTACDTPQVPSPRGPVRPGAGQREGPHSLLLGHSLQDSGSGAAEAFEAFEERLCTYFYNQKQFILNKLLNFEQMTLPQLFL